MDISRISVTKTVFVDVFSWYCFRNPGNPIDWAHMASSWQFRALLNRCTPSSDTLLLGKQAVSFLQCSLASWGTDLFSANKHFMIKDTLRAISLPTFWTNSAPGTLSKLLVGAPRRMSVFHFGGVRDWSLTEFLWMLDAQVTSRSQFLHLVTSCD